ncbi:hypothetical protein OUZ56_014406 [Daphnia magna]|uniref:Uncharacterized protein n=1 Tax=Daphnia magna TaxID=35525 RepID=A0ABR0AK23_9CRUS|nr:hypothetical protein OUZ56_014406 [Daphnia magna]
MNVAERRRNNPPHRKRWEQRPPEAPEGVFCCDVEFVVGQDSVAFQAVPGYAIEAFASAFTVHVDGRKEIKQPAKERFTTTGSFAFGDEPNDLLRFITRVVILRSAIQHRLQESFRIGWQQSRRQRNWQSIDRCRILSP